MARMSIYVPDALKARMDPWDKKENWSNVAQEAFERRLNSLTLRTGSNMNDVIERLRASKAEYVNKQMSIGATDGEKWARNQASYADLLDFSRIRLEDLEGTKSYAYTFNCLMGTDREDREDQWFYDDETKSFDENEYVYGYVKAAKEVWDEVSEHL